LKKLLLVDLSPWRSEMENFIGAKSPPGSEHGKLTLSSGFHETKCLNVSGTFMGKSISFFFNVEAFERVSQKQLK
jgi:hypothetical protein